MNSYSYQGLGKPKNIRRDLSPEKMELLEWLTAWDKKWKEFCKTLHALYVIQSIRFNKYPTLNRYEQKNDVHKHQVDEGSTTNHYMRRQKLTRRERKLQHLKRYSSLDEIASNTKTHSKHDDIYNATGGQYKLIGNSAWVQILIHISSFIIGDCEEFINELGVRVLEKIKTFEQSILKYKNPNYIPPPVPSTSSSYRHELASSQNIISSTAARTKQNTKMTKYNQIFMEHDEHDNSAVPKYQSMKLNVHNQTNGTNYTNRNPIKSQRQGRATTSRALSIKKTRRPLPSYRSAYVINQNLIERQKYISNQCQ